MNCRLYRLAAMFVLAAAAAGCRDLTAPDAPSCARPAPLLGSYDPAAPGVIVVYDANVDAVAETSRLALKYAFTPSHVYTAALSGFAATVSSHTVADLRCEASVSYVEYNEIMHAY